MEDITDADYRHTQNVWENFGKKTEVNITTYMFKTIQYC